MPSVFMKFVAASVAFVAVFQAAARAEELSLPLTHIKETGAFVVGYRDATVPLSYTGAGGQPVGLAIDLCGLVASKVKDALGLTDLKISYQPVTATGAPALLQSGAIAIDCGGVPVTAELQKAASFSRPIFVSELTWLVPHRMRVEREGRRRRIETISPASAEDLRDKTVALTQGSPAVSAALSLSSDRTLGLSIVEGKDNAESFKLLESGKASALLADAVQLASLKANAKNPDAFGFLGGGYPGFTYALMLPKDDKRFKDLVDGVLAETVQSGDYAKLYAKWFESPIPPKNVNLEYPMTEKLKEALQAPAGR